MSISDYIVVVSGLPRSGTSLMMQMLDAGGMPLLVDHERKPDEDNPKGYYEFEKVKEIEYDSSWLDQAKGKAVKIVSPLLQHLKIGDNYRYKIIFMQRDLDEVLASQKKMAQRLKKQEDSVDDRILKQNYIKHLEEIEDWLEKQKNIEVLCVKYTDVLSHPDIVADEVCSFLGIDLNREAMTKVVDPSLYRQKSSGAEEKPIEAAQQDEADREVIMNRLKDLGYL